MEICSIWHVRPYLRVLMKRSIHVICHYVFVQNISTLLGSESSLQREVMALCWFDYSYTILLFDRALVEVKPLLHAPVEEISTPAGLQNQDRTDEHNLWGFAPSDVHNSCCQQYVFCRKICTAVISITEETAARACSETDDCDEKHLKRIVRLCIYLLDQIIKNNNFTWAELMVSSLVYDFMCKIKLFRVCLVGMKEM